MRNTQSGRKGGRSTLLKYGREHYREMARKSAARLVQRPKKVKKGDEDEEGELYVHSLRHPLNYLSHRLRFLNVPTSSFTHVS